MYSRPVKYVWLQTVSGEAGFYELAIGKVVMPEAEPEITRPPALSVQRFWSKKRVPERVLPLKSSGALVLRADLAKAAFAGTPITTQPITVVMTDGKTKVSGWVFVPIDAWVAGDEDLPAPLARLVEHPRVIVAEPALATKLAKLSGNAIRAIDDADELERFAPTWIKPAVKPPSPKAAAAYRKLLAGDRTARKAALADPHHALAVALQIDRKPAADTRAAACAHAVHATLYALLVDRGPHARTRAAAAKTRWTEARYAYAVDLAIPPALAKRMVPGAFSSEELQCMQETLAALAGRPAAGPAQQPELATRKLPKRPAGRVERIAKAITDAEVRADIDEMTERGLARIAAVPADDPSKVIDKLHRYVDQVRAGTAKLGKKAHVARLELACAYAAQLHRAFGWQWTRTPDAVGIAAPNGSHTIELLPMFARIAKPGGGSNTIALQFNMIAAGDLPKAKRAAFVGLKLILGLVAHQRARLCGEDRARRREVVRHQVGDVDRPGRLPVGHGHGRGRRADAGGDRRCGTRALSVLRARLSVLRARVCSRRCRPRPRRRGGRRRTASPRCAVSSACARGARGSRCTPGW